MSLPAVGIDFETKYRKKDYSVGSLGNFAYTRHAEFDPFIISVCDGAESWAGNPRDFNWEALRDRHLVAHNAAFDSEVYEAMVERGLAPRIPILKWSCTANMTSALSNRRSLADAWSFFYGEKVDKTARDALEGKVWADLVADPVLMNRSLEYARLDAWRCQKMWTDLSPRWSPFEQQISEHTMLMTRRGFPVDVKRATRDRDVLNQALFALRRHMPWIEDGMAPTSPKAIAEKCREAGIPCPPVKSHDGGEEAFIAWEETYASLFPFIQAVTRWRSITKELANVEALLARIRPDGVLQYGAKYFGAHTGRLSGENGFNMFNLRKVPLYFDEQFEWIEPKDDGDPELPAAYAVDARARFVPPPGHVLGIVDSAQIEPRVTHWMAGNTPFLDRIRGGLEIYEAFARSVDWYNQPEELKGNKPYEKIRKTSKACVIGGGYGIGPGKFKGTAKKLAGLDVTDEESAQIIAQYRAANPQIVGLWDRLTRDFESSVGGNYELELPSGRSLMYRDVRRERVAKRDKKTGVVSFKWSTTAEIDGRRYSMWGGSLTENAVQAISRDIFMHQTLLVEKSVGPVLLHVYDEDVCALKIEDANERLAEMVRIHNTAPDWAPGLPLGTSARLADFYLKD